MNYRRLGTWLLMLTIVSSLVVWAAAPAGDIAAVASKNKDLSTFVKAVKAAGLADDFKKPGPFTVFAPTNEAFKKLPSATLTSLLKPENKAKLRSILLYHVVKGRHTAADVMKAKTPMMLTSLEGAKLKVTHKPKMVMVNNATVTKPDIMATNGVIHTINTVLTPPAKKR